MKPVSSRAAKHIVVIGGGISGLSAAYQIQKYNAGADFPLKITLVEADRRLGGKILTEYQDGFTIEGGPDCFLRQKPWAAELAAELSIQGDLMGTNDHQRKVYVLDGGRLKPLPDGVMLIIPTRIMPFALSTLISLPGKLRMGLDWFIPALRGTQDESVGHFIRRRLGREALNKIAEPLMSGIHVSDPEKQSLLATFPRFRSIEQKHGSLIRGMLAERKSAAAARPNNSTPSSVFMTFQPGMNHLINRLETHLTGCRILTGTTVTAIRKDGQDGYAVLLSSGEILPADAIVMAIPAYHAAPLLGPLSLDIAARLGAIQYISTATISMAFRKKEVKKAFVGFGFVIPRSENREISACTWSSLKFNHRAPKDTLLLRCFVGGPGKEDRVALDDDELVHRARKELGSILDLDAEPIFTRIFRWHKANPQYEVGHLARVQDLFAACRLAMPGIFLTGSAYEGVGVPDCIKQGRQAAAAAIAFLQAELTPV
ncbi:MAG: protoporphyrinogen oxidase [Anaerolineaceae bacterium]|jgi:oxygen-dependent protoporphyrinogen oxidase